MSFEKSPLRYPKSGDMRQIRLYLEDQLAAYTMGALLFPKARVANDIDRFPRRVKPAAQGLIEAWTQIDEDREVHGAFVHNAVDTLTAKPFEEGDTAGRVMTAEGRNAVRWTNIYREAGKLSIIYNVEEAGQFIDDELDGQEFPLPDGGVMSFDSAGNLQLRDTEPSGVVIRRGGRKTAMLMPIEDRNAMVQSTDDTTFEQVVIDEDGNLELRPTSELLAG